MDTMTEPRTAGLSRIPTLGAGLGYRRELTDAILAMPDAVDFLEIVTEQFMFDVSTLGELEELCDQFVVIPHGIGLSLGSPSLDPAYLRAIQQISDITGSPYYSEHLAVTRAPGLDIGHLSPLWFTPAVERNTIDNILRVQDVLRKPLVVENITYPFDIPFASMRQTEFLSRLVEATGCGLLLDLANLHINAVNHDFDPIDFLCELPLDRVIQVHLAGGFDKDGMMIDSHSEAIAPGTWTLLEWLAAKTALRGAILEHDGNFPEDPGVLFEQVERARAFLPRAAIREEQHPS